MKNYLLYSSAALLFNLASPAQAEDNRDDVDTSQLDVDRGGIDRDHDTSAPDRSRDDNSNIDRDSVDRSHDDRSDSESRTDRSNVDHDMWNG